MALLNQYPETTNPMDATVVVITLDRPDCARRCLQHLSAQTVRPSQIIVVDASKSSVTADLIRRDFPEVVYLRNEFGYGNMPMSRNIGIRNSTGDIIAFLDDDAFAEPQWLEALIATYADPAVGAVGGRALNGQPGEATKGVDEIGRIRPNGLITQNFAANPGRIVDVDIIIGCNMSFRRDVLTTLGGMREHYTGTGSCEDTDICLRVRKLGFKIRFNPAACAEHIGAPQFKGRRFDLRYDVYGFRNYLILLVLNYGVGDPFFYRAFGYLLRQAAMDFVRKVFGGALSGLGRICGALAGLAMGIYFRITEGSDPRRHDAKADEIRRALTAAKPAKPSSAARQPSEPMLANPVSGLK